MAPTDRYTLSLHDALPIWADNGRFVVRGLGGGESWDVCDGFPVLRRAVRRRVAQDELVPGPADEREHLHPVAELLPGESERGYAHVAGQDGLAGQCVGKQ